MDSEFDLNASPLETPSRESGGVCSTPDTEVSVSFSSSSKHSSQRSKTWAANKIAQLTQEEKVCFSRHLVNVHSLSNTA